MASNIKAFLERASNKGEGKLYTKEEAKISVQDVGFQRGFGVFETMRSYNGKLFRLEEHVERLVDSADRLGLKFSWSKNELTKRIQLTVEKNDMLDELSMRVIISGGKDQGHMEVGDPVLIIIPSELTVYPSELYQEGVGVISVQGRRFLPEVKSLDYLEGVLAVRQARERGAHEALYCTKEGNVLEATTSNFFIIKDKTLITPKEGILRGVTRKAVLEITLGSQLDVEQREVSLEETYRADEAFLTSTHRELLPVVQVNHKKIGEGKPGKVTNALLSKFRDKAHGN